MRFAFIDVEKASYPLRVQSVREATSEFIEVFYYRIRRHSTVGNISPAKFEEMNQAEAA